MKSTLITLLMVALSSAIRVEPVGHIVTTEKEAAKISAKKEEAEARKT